MKRCTIERPPSQKASAITSTGAFEDGYFVKLVQAFSLLPHPCRHAGVNKAILRQHNRHFTSDNSLHNAKVNEMTFTEQRPILHLNFALGVTSIASATSSATQQHKTKLSTFASRTTRTVSPININHHAVDSAAMAGGEKWRKRRAAKQAAAAARPQPRPRNMLISMLAPELQLAVLSHLPVKQIQKCRAVNRYLRDLIDSPENQTICAQPGLARAQKKFTQFRETLVEYDVDAVDELGVPSGFLNALVAYTKLRGIAEESCIAYYVCVSEFSQHWLQQCDKKDALLADNANSNRKNDVCLAARAIHLLHLHHRGVEILRRDQVAGWETTLQQEEYLKLMRMSADQVGAAILQKVADGALDGVSTHKEGNLVDCIAYESPHNFKLRGRLSKLGRQELNIRISFGAETLDEILDEAEARENATDLLAEHEDEATWSKVPTKRALRGHHLSDLESQRPDKRFSLVEEAENRFEMEDDEDYADGWVIRYDDIGNALKKKFGLERFPATLPFDYYVRSARVAAMIKGILRTDKKLSLLERAAMLDRILIW